jgi:hypothetical protein
VTITAANLIDDMAAGTPAILMQGGRVGSWYTYNDGTGSQIPSTTTPCVPAGLGGGYCGSSNAQHTQGSGFTTWGAGLGFDFDNTGSGTRHAYDVSGLTGIAFQATGPTTLRFMVTEMATTPTAQGGSCTTNCSDAHGVAISLGSGWAQHVIPFSSLTQVGWWTPASFAPSTALSVQFQVAQGQSFDFSITDIGFY